MNTLKNKYLLSWLACMGLLLVAPAALRAADPCDHDRPKVCGGVTPGEGRMHTCLMQNLDHISPACGKVVKRAEELDRSMETLCADDISTFCALYKDRARVVQCLHEKHKSLRSQCKRAFDDYYALGYKVRQ
jgi:hypothetical protein